MSDPAINSSWLIEDVRLIDPERLQESHGRLLIHQGKIAAIDPLDDDIPSEAVRIHGAGRILAPGLIDIGTELGEPGREEDETIATGGRAALAGGYTSLACASNTEPPVDSAASVQFILHKAARANLCRVHVIGCVSKNRQGMELAEIGSLVEAGAVALSDAPRAMENTALLRRALEYCSMFHVPVLDHPEVPSLSPQGVMHEGWVQLVLGLTPMPAESEDLATARDLRLVEATGGRLHLTGISTMGSVELCRAAKKKGLSISVGIAAANFLLIDEALRGFDANCKLNPPLRSEEHLASCLEGLRDGTIDLIASGHRPRSLEKKMQELDAAPFGMVSLETTLSSVITHLIRPKILDWPTALRKLSYQPAQLLGLSGGCLKVGQLADLILIDPDYEWRVDAEQFCSKGANSPLDGQVLHGRVTHTWVDGQLRHQVRQNGSI